MLQLARVHWLRSIEFVYAVVALFALTQGPVLRLWKPSEALLGSLPNPTIPHVHFTTFVIVQLPGVLLWARRVNTSWFRERANQALLVFLTWIAFSVVWSTFARLSAPEYVALVLTTIFGLYLAEAFNARQIWSVIAGAMALGVGFSWIAIMRLWDEAVNFQEDYWIGIYYNRNSLAPVAAVAILGAMGVAFGSIQFVKAAITSRSLVEIVSASALTVFASIELWRSQSQTSPSALAIAVAVCAAWLIVRYLTSQFDLLSGVARWSVPLVLVISAVFVFLAMRQEIGVGGVDSQTTAFNQRSGIWALSWAGILEKPWHGWGWMSAWHTPLFFLSSEEPTWMAWGLELSHNGYHDILLGGGAPAGVLFAAFIVIASRRLSEMPFAYVIPRLLMIAFVLAAATQESFFVGSHFLWALLVACLATQTTDHDLIDEKHSSQSSI